MKFKQLYFPDDFKPVENNDEVKNGSSKSLDMPAIETDNNRGLANSFMLQIQEMNIINAQLEKLVEQRTKKLTEVVAKNVKFISIIAHDLKNPFTSILIALELLKEKLGHNNIDDIDKYISIASDSANRTLILLESLLTWASSQNIEKSFNPVKINLHDLLNEEISNINNWAKQKQILLIHSFNDNLLHVCADLQMVKTVLRNLISNAIKYTSSGGAITIYASEHEKLVEITIKDNGIGISPEAQKKLFKIDSFQSTAGTNNEKGSGLGLILCKEFIELHGGSIWIESESGKGCEFKFTLPQYI
jgi:signal transduction histidine kinase